MTAARVIAPPVPTTKTPELLIRDEERGQRAVHCGMPAALRIHAPGTDALDLYIHHIPLTSSVAGFLVFLFLLLFSFLQPFSIRGVDRFHDVVRSPCLDVGVCGWRLGAAAWYRGCLGTV